jgi:eukaryotic-like serine/threonine-protein kinase
MQLVENAVVAGRFRLNRLIQRGGMGSVWHATHLGLDIPCAVKFVKGELLDNEDVVSRFEREAKSAAQLRSPHVVQILDHGVCEGTPYIAMELLDGEDLDVRLQRVGRLAPSELHKVMSEVCRALSKAHAMGIVHRDLKPANIYMVRDDDHEITKVLDFGIAKSRISELAGSATKTGAMLGTPYYMSPEQAQGTKTVDFRSDLWSLAVIAFQCLTGHLPFDSEALGDLLMKIMVAPIPVPSQLASVPASFDRWWAKAASRDAAERFQSAKEFSDSLAVVCGISQVSSVIDRSRFLHIKAEAAAEPPMTQAETHAPAQTAAGPDPATRREATVAFPQVAESGVLPPTVKSEGSDAVPGGTPAPLSRSVAMDPPVDIPRSKAPLFVALALGGLVLIGALFGIGMVWHARSTPTAAASATPSQTASTTPAPTDTTAAAPSSTAATATAPTASTPPPVTSSDTTPTPTTTSTPTTTPTTTPSTGHGGGSPPTTSHGKPPSTTAKPTTNPAPGKPGVPADVGF